MELKIFTLKFTTFKILEQSLLFAFISLTACKNDTVVTGVGAKGTVKNDNAEGDKKTTPTLPGQTQPGQVAILPPEQANVSAKQAALTVCNAPKESSERKTALQIISAYKLGTEKYDNATAIASPAACIDSIRLAAIYVNLVSGVPASTLIGQALQETGFCKSNLAQLARNFHGMKATVDKKYFTNWAGEHYTKASSESVTGEGNLVVSAFMKFTHPDFSFYSLAERLIIPEYPYLKCIPKRNNTVEFMNCVGASWAVHGEYAKAVLGFRTTYKLEQCELTKNEWQLNDKFKNISN